ncbi:unnamed protein product, partial [Staurois parvus]
MQPSSAATSQCPAVVPVSAQQLRQSMPSIAASQCPAVMPVSATYQCCLSVPIISAAYPCHLISAAYQCPSVLPISAAYQCPSVLPHQRTSVKEKNYLF